MSKLKATKAELSKPKTEKKGSGTASVSRFRVQKILFHLLGVVALVGGMIFLVDVTKQYIEQNVTGPVGPLRVALVNKPVWMSDYLAEQIAATVPKTSSSAFDHDLLVATVDKLNKNPWVAEVRQVRRVYGERPGDTLEVDCDFRAPIALVKWGEFYWLVDNDGYVLPEQFTDNNLAKITTGRDGRTSIRVIDGVHQAPPESGRKWAGADLAAGLELVKLFYGKLYLDEVSAVDVTNFGGRVKKSAPQLVLDTRYGSQIWWGQPLNTKDFFVEVAPARKLEILKAVVQQHGRIDANQAYVDVRYDDFLVPTTQPTPLHAKPVLLMVQHDKQFLRVLAWGFLQLGILGIGASGCALWAHHPFPRESLALQEMLAGQALIFALLFPVLFSTWRGLVVTIALMLPMDELSGMMSNASQTSIWMGFGCVALWLAGLGGLGLLITQRYQVATVGLATLLTVGGGILDYLRWEAAATNGQTSVFLPIGMLPQLCRAIETPSAMPWIQAGMPTIVLTVTLILRLSIPPRSGPSTSLHSLS